MQRVIALEEEWEEYKEEEWDMFDDVYAGKVKASYSAVLRAKG